MHSEELLDEMFSGAKWIDRTRGVYFLQAGLFIKIGMSNCVLRRATRISQSTPITLVPLGFIRTDTRAAARLLERQLHTRFADLRHRCEWFHGHDALLEFIKTEAEPWPTIAQRRDGWVHMIKLMKIKEAARQLGVDAQTVRRYIKHGVLRAVKLPSGHWRVADVDVEACVGKGQERST
jgi:excisionase family DNA binding protein